MINIHTSRVFIPYPTDAGVFSVPASRCDKMRYEMQKRSGNWDDYSEMAEFYNVISAAYKINLRPLPEVVPFVQYVDFIRRCGGDGLNRKSVIMYLKYSCNTLIITDKAERDYVEALYLNVLRHDIGLFEFNPGALPARFAKISQKVR